MHSSSRAPLPHLKAELEKYIGKLGTTVVGSKIRFSVIYSRKTQRPRAGKPRENNQIENKLEEAPTFNSQTETTDFSEPEPELELIDFRDFSKPEPESMDFSEPEPETTVFSEPEPEIDLMILEIFLNLNLNLLISPTLSLSLNTCQNLKQLKLRCL